MFKNTLKEYDIDVKKMPLGKISQTQIQKGMAVLEQMKISFDNKKGRKDLETLTSQFYSIIPHSCKSLFFFYNFLNSNLKLVEMFHLLLIQKKCYKKKLIY